MDLKISEILEQRKKDGLFRQITTENCADCVDFTHNSYLNLHENPEMIDSGLDYVNKFGTSSKSSILLSKQGLYFELSSIVSKTIQKQGVVIFPTGYQMNSTAIPAILNLSKNQVVITDREVHASIHHGIKLSNNRENRYKHNDLNSLEDILKKNTTGDRFVFTESVFSMSGEVLDIENFIYLKRKYGFFAYIDEAHAIGVFGSKGEGVCAKFSEEIDIIAGTMGKAIGSIGGYVGCSKLMDDYLTNFATGLIYSTAISPFSIGCSVFAFENLLKFQNDRARIFNNIEILKSRCPHLVIKSSGSQILQIVHNSIEKCLETYNFLKNDGILTSIVRYPTVPKGQYNIRISINSTMKLAELV